MTNHSAGVLILREHEIRDLITVGDTLDAVREAFEKLAADAVILPGVLTFDMREYHAEVHAKGAHVGGAPYFTIKVAGSFQPDAAAPPANGGAVCVFDARTGAPSALLFDNGLLTTMRTGAAGALATDLLAPDRVESVTVVGTGMQARCQVEALLAVRRPSQIWIWGRREEAARQCAAELAAAADVEIRPASSLKEAVADADVIVTTTSAREPLVQADWVRAGAHVTAVGSDMAGKVELDPLLLARATVVADSLEQCRTQGEIAAAIDAGAIRPGDVHAELADIVTGRRPGRTSQEEITVADLTGVGVTDATVAMLVAARARERQVGQQLEIGSGQ